MSTTVDSKVVEMRFDNRQFENNVQTTMNTLDKLTGRLKFTGATKGLEEVNSAAKNVDMNGLGSAVETVHAKFSALQIVGITALTRITNAAIDTGKRMVSALTIDPIKSGLSEYETKINSIQTIMSNTASKGTTMEDVTRVIGELNTYADKTIYNFSEMTRNIGTFTAAGVGLEESAAAIQGIANLAAASGSTSQQASTAMYQLSQALSSGTVKLMDWNSVVNAGMGGEKFQEALKATARDHGVAVDDMIEKNGSFRESLQEGWITADILNETLNKFTVKGAKEYAQSMVESGKYTQEQADALIKEAQAMEDAATKVKTFTQLWDTLKESAQSGWSQTWEIIIGDFEEAKEVLTQISDVIGGFISKSADARNEMLENWKVLGGRKALIDAFKNAFEAVLSVVRPIKEAFRDIFPAMTSSRLVAITEGLRDFMAKLKLSDSTSKKLKRTFKGLFALMSIAIQVISAIARGFGDLLGYIAPVGGGLLEFTASLGDGIVKLNEFLKSSKVFNTVIGAITSVLGAIITGVKNFVASIADAMKSFFKIDMSGVESFTDKLKLLFQPFIKLGEGIWKIFQAIGKLIKKLFPVFSAIASRIGEAFSGIGSGMMTAIENADFEALFDIINGLLTGGLVVGIQRFIHSLKNITDGAGDFVEGFTGVFDVFEAYQQSLKADAILKIAASIAILAAALVIMSRLDPERLASALAAISTLFAELFGSMAVFSRIMSKDGFKGMLKTTVSMMALSLAVLILSAAMRNLAKLDWKGIGKGLVGVAGLSAILVVSAKVLSTSSRKLIKGATGLIAFALAILVLSSAVKKLSTIDTKSMTRGLIGVGVLCAELALFLKVADFDGMGALKGVGLIALAGAINILASAVGKFAALDANMLTKGLASVAIVLAELAIFTKVTSGSKKMMSIGIGLVLLGAAMLIFAEAIERMGSLSWTEIGKGLLTMAAALTIVTVAVNMMPLTMILSSIGLLAIATALVVLAYALSIMGGMSWEAVAKGLIMLAGALLIIAVAVTAMLLALPGAAALLVIAAALAILVPALLLLGTMSWGEIGKSLLMLAGMFVVLGASAVVLAPLTPVILALAAAMALLGIGCIAVGVGILAFSMGLTALATSGAVGAAAFASIVTTLIGLIPTLIAAIGAGIIAFVQVIVDGMPVILEAVTKIVIGILDVLIKAIPKVIELVGVLITGVLELVLTYIPKVVETVFLLIAAILNTIAEAIPMIIDAGVNILISLIRGIGQAIPKLVDAAFKAVIDFLNGMADALRSNTPLLIDAVNNLMDAVVDAVKAWVKNFSGAGSDMMSGFIQGIKDMAKKVWDAAVGVVKDAWNGVKDFLGINSPSKEAIELAKYVDEGFIIGFKKYSDRVADSAEGVGKDALVAMKDAVSGASDLISNNVDSEPTIRPVLDLSDVKHGAREIGSLFGSGASVGVLANVGAIGSMMNRRNQNGANDDVVSAIDKLREDMSSAPHTVYNINGVSYTSDSEVGSAIETLVRAIRIGGRV